MRRKFRFATRVAAGTALLFAVSGCGAAPVQQPGAAEPDQTRFSASATYRAPTETPSRSPRPEPTPARWADAPTDGVWSEPDSSDTSFGRMSTPGRLDEYSVGIRTRPTLTTDDTGATVTVSSVLKVKRVSEKWPGEPVADDLKLAWEPGERTPAHQMDESWGTRPDVSCTPEILKAGESGECTVAFTAPGSEVANSYWQVGGARIGTWPSQRAGK